MGAITQRTAADHSITRRGSYDLLISQIFTLNGLYADLKPSPGLTREW